MSYMALPPVLGTRGSFRQVKLVSTEQLMEEAGFELDFDMFVGWFLLGP